MLDNNCPDISPEIFLVLFTSPWENNIGKSLDAEENISHSAIISHMLLHFGFMQTLNWDRLILLAWPPMDGWTCMKFMNIPWLKPGNALLCFTAECYYRVQIWAPGCLVAASHTPLARALHGNAFCSSYLSVVLSKLNPPFCWDYKVSKTGTV